MLKFNNLKLKSNIYFRLFFYIPKNIRRKYYLATFLVGIVGLFEFFSLSSLLIFFDNGLGIKNDFLEFLDKFEFLRNLNINIFLLSAMFLFSLKTILILFVGKYSYSTALQTKRFLQNKMFRIFLDLPLEKHLLNNSSDWVRRLTIDSLTLEGRLFTPLLVVLGEIIPCIFIGFLLFNVNPSVFIFSLTVFILLGSLLFFNTNKTLVRLGEKQQISDTEIVNLTQQVKNGIRELSLYKLEDWVYKRFRVVSTNSTDAANKALFIGLLPRFTFEICVYLSIGIIFGIYTIKSVQLINIIGEAAVFLAAAMRLLPSISKIVSHLQSFKHAKPAVQSVRRILDIEKNNIKKYVTKLDQKANFKTLEIKNLYFKFNDKDILKNINFEISKGDKIAIVGESGCGKTTLMNSILGLYKPYKGKILLNGTNIHTNFIDYWNLISYVPQEPFLINESLIENVKLGLDINEKQEANIKNMLRFFKFSKKLIDKNYKIGENGNKLSGGQKQRLSIARALFRKPEILFLDESTSAMDISTEADIMELIFERMKNKTIIMISHRNEILKYFKKKISISNGYIYE